MMKNLINKLFGYLGYCPMEQNYKQILSDYFDSAMECRGLVNAIGYLERENEEHNLLLSCLILSQGQEEMVLTKEFLADTLSKQVETVFGQEQDGNIKMVVQLKGEQNAD